MDVLEKDEVSGTVSPIHRAVMLKGYPVVEDIERWCRKHRTGIKPALAVIYFDTGDDADEYLRIKADVAAKAGIAYLAYKLSPKASPEEVEDTIAELSQDDSIHGILIQRPIPRHLSERDIMSSVYAEKHVEEYSRRKAHNIAVDGVIRLLSEYGRARMLKDFDILLVGGENIITKGFKAELKRRFRSVQTLVGLPSEKTYSRSGNTILITELNRGGFIKPDMISPDVKMVIDLGFDVDTKMGDLDAEIFEMDGIVVVPTPGGVLPVLLWLMMERTIRASLSSGRGRWRLGIPSSCVIL